MEFIFSFDFTLLYHAFLGEFGIIFTARLISSEAGNLRTPAMRPPSMIFDKLAHLRSQAGDNYPRRSRGATIYSNTTIQAERLSLLS